MTSELPNRAKSQSDPSLLDLLVSSLSSFPIFIHRISPHPFCCSFSFLLFIFLFFLDASDLLLAVFDTLPQSVLTSFR